MAGTAAAQDQNEGFFKSPVFLFMPGIVTVNAISAPEGVDSESELLLRFQTTLPTATPWFTPVFGTQWAPRGFGPAFDNSLTFFYGFVVPIIQPELTNGYLSITIDPLGVYSAGGGNTAKPYGHDFFLEGAAVFSVGSMLMPQSTSPFSKLALYFLLDQRITHTGGDDFNPVLLYGLALPIAPWG
jgi:hypothetical protein